MTGSGTVGDPYIISTVTDLQAIEDDLTAYYELGGNIDASATSGWNGGEGFVPIGRGGTAFSGQLDGKGYSISDLFIDMPTDSYIGLFGILDNGAVLKNIAMTGVDITGSSYVGALLGQAGTGDSVDIDDCSSAGAIASTVASASNIGGLIGEVRAGTIDGCWSSCTVTVAATNTSTNVGGLIGNEYGTTAITSCYATGNVTSGGGRVGGLIGNMWNGSCDKCYATGDVVAGHDCVGGLVGRIDESATLDDCYARGDATIATRYYAGGLVGLNDSGTIDDCYATGTATCVDSDYTGGLIGTNYGTVTNCFWDTEASGNATSDGGTGETTSEMKTQSTFTSAGWNFTTIWGIFASLNNGYPGFGRSVASELTGNIRVIEERLHYSDAYGVERYIEGTAI